VSSVSGVFITDAMRLGAFTRRPLTRGALLELDVWFLSSDWCETDDESVKVLGSKGQIS